MKDTIRFGRIAGIPVGAHWSVLAFGGLMTLTLGSTILPSLVQSWDISYGAATYWVVALVGVFAFAGSILAHELGHAIVARRNSVRTEGITLWMLGGVARLEREPDTPGSAFRIAAAGPAVSLALAVLAAGAAWAGSSFGLPIVLVALLLWLALVNTSLALFNLIPASPLDGGRILQAALWHRSGDGLGATITAAKAGRVFGTALIAFGIYQMTSGTGNGLWLIGLGFFILSAARAERRHAEHRRRMQTSHTRRSFDRPFGTPVDLIDVLTGNVRRPQPIPVVIDVTSRPVNRRMS